METLETWSCLNSQRSTSIAIPTDLSEAIKARSSATIIARLQGCIDCQVAEEFCNCVQISSLAFPDVILGPGVSRLFLEKRTGAASLLPRQTRAERAVDTRADQLIPLEVGFLVDAFSTTELKEMDLALSLIHQVEDNRGSENCLNLAEIDSARSRFNFIWLEPALLCISS